MVVDEPELINQTRGLDFGSGFYLTTNESQAIRFSEIVVNRRKSGIATVSIYDFDMDKAERIFKVCKFEHTDEKWLNFVAENRLKTYNGPVYDIIIGAVANDTVMPTIQAFLGGFLSVEATLITLKTSKLTDQLCFKSNNALSLLQFVKAYDTREDDNNE